MSTSTRIAPDLPDGPQTRSRARWSALAALAALTALGWIYLGMMIAGHLGGPMEGMPAHAGHGGLAALGPGMGWLDRWLPAGGVDPTLRAVIDALCRPRFGHAAAAETAGEAAVAALMWVAMVFAMMLPTAVPMVMAASRGAAAADRRHRDGFSPLAVLAGYLSVWTGYAVVAAAAQVALTHAALLDAGMATASPLFAGAIFIAAGLYQFSPLKDACTANCRRPVPFFFADANGRVGGFRLGLQQGRFCVGCCWAMMLVMFAVGTMNVVWMAGLGLVMAVEKIAGSPRSSRGVGLAMMAGGGVIIAIAVVARWPA
jgi:predicted metal-binding membrane protein